MEKDFDQWNTSKKRLDSSSPLIRYHEREIWWCAFGVNVGFEQDGTGRNFDRPALILRGFSPHVCVAIPLTGSKREGIFYSYLGRMGDRDASVVLSQIRLIDTRRLIRKMATLEEEKFKKVKIALRDLLFC